MIPATIAPEEGQEQKEPQHHTYGALQTLQFRYGTQKLPLQCALASALVDVISHYVPLQKQNLLILSQYVGFCKSLA